MIIPIAALTLEQPIFSNTCIIIFDHLILPHQYVYYDVCVAYNIQCILFSNCLRNIHGGYTVYHYHDFKCMSI